MKYCKIWLHGILSTNNKLPFINDENESFIINLLKDCFHNQGSEVHQITALKEHVHILFECNPEKAFAEILEKVQEESAVLINEKFFKANSFGWEKGYVLFSVSESQVSKLKEYISQQKDFHKNKNFSKELDDFLLIHHLNK